MRNPLSPLQAFAEDARLVAERQSDVGDDMLAWLSVAQSAEQLATLPARRREEAMEQAKRLLSSFAQVRPTMVHDAEPAPTDALEVLSEQFRAAAEAMERGGCFELAFSTVSSVCRLSASQRYVSSALATTHLGRIARSMNDLPMAEDCYQSVLSVCARERDGPLSARGHIGIALLHDMKGNVPAAEREYLTALRLAVPMRHSYAMASQALMTLAMHAGRLADALLYGWQSYDAFDVDREAKTAVLSDLSGIALRAGFTEAALRGFEHALSLSTVPRTRVYMWAGAIRAAARLNDLARVHRMDAELLRDIARANQPFDAAWSYICAAEAWWTVDEPARAGVRLASSRDLSFRFGFHEYQFRADALEAAWNASPNATNRDERPSTLDGALAVAGSRQDVIVDRGIRRLEELAV